MTIEKEPEVFAFSSFFLFKGTNLTIGNWTLKCPTVIARFFRIFKIGEKGCACMMRVLSPAEQSCLTVDAQALIYRYRTQKWLTQKQFEDLITEVVTISRMRQFPGDAELVAAVLHDLGETDALEEALESLFQKQESDHLFS
ncbi:hypothetical protein [Pyramidobacter piscolens]|uniref:hypothetical protein n=2 Tax=Pyramidobacter piscolens TaxID=638849 RepID=UPI000590CFB5|nr:hypothetical protein [Pyramidobacter piscolens]